MNLTLFTIESHVNLTLFTIESPVFTIEGANKHAAKEVGAHDAAEPAGKERKRKELLRKYLKTSKDQKPTNSLSHTKNILETKENIAIKTK